MKRPLSCSCWTPKRWRSATTASLLTCVFCRRCAAACHQRRETKILKLKLSPGYIVSYLLSAAGGAGQGRAGGMWQAVRGAVSARWPPQLRKALLFGLFSLQLPSLSARWPVPLKTLLDEWKVPTLRPASAGRDVNRWPFNLLANVPPLTPLPPRKKIDTKTDDDAWKDRKWIWECLFLIHWACRRGNWFWISCQRQTREISA